MRGTAVGKRIDESPCSSPIPIRMRTIPIRNDGPSGGSANVLQLQQQLSGGFGLMNIRDGSFEECPAKFVDQTR